MKENETINYQASEQIISLEQKIALLQKENKALKEDLMLRDEYKGHVSVLDNIPLALINLDKDGNFIFGNDFFFSLFDLDYSFIDKSTNISSFSPLWGTELIEKLDVLLKKQETFNMETSLKQDLQKRIYKARGVAIVDDEGNINSYLIIIGDITQRKLAESQLIGARDRAEESDRLKTAFISNISHEIRTPINHIMGFLELLSMDDIDGETRNEYRNIIYNSSHSLLNSIENIIDIARIKSGQIKLKTNEVKVNDIIRSVFKLTNEIVIKNNKQHLAIRTKVPRDSAAYCIQIDDYRLTQIIKNMVENAIKFTNEGYVEFGYKQSKNGHLYFYVRDTGIGIDKEDFENIFDNFRQVDYRNTREVEGSGLGLSIAKGLAELLNAQIDLRSVIGKGSVFSLYFPKIKCNLISKCNGIQKEIFDAGF